MCLNYFQLNFRSREEPNWEHVNLILQTLCKNCPNLLIDSHTGKIEGCFLEFEESLGVFIDGPSLLTYVCDTWLKDIKSSGSRS